MDVEMSNHTVNLESLCVVCQANSEQPYIDIYTTQTDSSRCLLSEFISKTSQIKFDRDKMWSKTVCQRCYSLIIQLDEAETQYLKLKNDFIDVLSKNKLLNKLPKVGEQMDDGVLCEIKIKSETNDEDSFSRDATPVVSDDSDDEPLLGRSARKKNKSIVDIIPENMKVETIKCEFDEQANSVEKEVFACRCCKQEFETKSQAAVHAFTEHRVDVAKEPNIIKVKGGKKGRRGRKKAKRKSFADLAGSDADDPDKDKDWKAENVSKSGSRSTRQSKRHGVLLSQPIHISGEEPELTWKTSKKKEKISKDLQKKLASNSVTIKKVGSTSNLDDPALMMRLGEDIMIKSEDGVVANDVDPSKPSDEVVVPKVKAEKRPYVKKQKTLLSCTQCPATFTSQNRMDLHMVKHTGTLSPYICEICGASYKHKKACDIHVEMHKGISPWKCNLCDKIFPSKGALCRHEAIHTGTPNYQCDLCGKSFIHTSSFKMHKLSHSGLKPHSCNKCGLALMTRSHLKRHQRVHSGEKRHECNTCGKKFSERYNLYAHQKSHDPTGAQVSRQSKTHDCTVCEASFNRRYVLEKHMEQVHQRVMEPMPKKTRNTMTKLLKQQALLQQQQQNTTQPNTSESHDTEVKLLINKTPPAQEDSSSIFISEATFQAGSLVHPTGLIVVTKQELPEASINETTATSTPPTTAAAASSTAAPTVTTASTVGLSTATAPSMVWQGLYQLANDYPLRMHGVDYLGRSGH